jgi:RHS repeat-associated protein
MKTLQFLILGLLTTTAVFCHAQTTDPGWYNSQQRDDTPSIADDNTTPPTETDPPTPPTYTVHALLVQQTPTNIAEAVTPDIQALADSLQDDPVKIYNYVHDNIKFVLYFGSKKGAELTLLEKSGNDFDQCALLVAMLRAANCSATYDFAWQAVPFDAKDGSHNDLHHWLQLNMTNSNSQVTSNYLVNLFWGIRGYPAYYFLDTNTFMFQRPWVQVTINSTTYNLDPAFKVSEPIASVINLTNAMGFNSNTLMSAAGGTASSTSVSGLSESSINGKLVAYTTNLLNYIQSNAPNASVDQILGGWQIVPSTNTAMLPRYLPFTVYTWNQPGVAVMPVVTWTAIPTNLMSTFSVTFAGTNYQCFMPQLQGQRLTLTYDTNGVGQLWQDDNLLAQKSTASSDTNVVLYINHPIGNWNWASNYFIDTTFDDQNVTNSYQRTNATYGLIYAFEPDWGWLQKRQNMLDAYRQQGLSDTSRQVMSETLNIMGLGWILQTETAGHLFETQLGVLHQYHNILGRMALEGGKGYYIDVYMQMAGLYPNSGLDSASLDRWYRDFDLSGYFDSALEHGIIEQLQNSNLVASSTVKMLEIANTNAQTVYLANSSNWSTVQSSLVNYPSAVLSSIGSKYINNNYYIMLPQNGSNHVSSVPGSWAGYAYVGHLNNGGTNVAAFIISGGYHGGYVSDPNATPSSGYVDSSGDSQSGYFSSTPILTPNPSGADPVNMADGTFQIEHTDITRGKGQEPTGLSFTRYYSSARRNSTVPGLPAGWTHNYYLNALPFAAPQSGLGGTTPAQAAPLIAATCAAAGIYNQAQPNPKNWMVAALISKWAVDQLSKNGVAVTLGNDTVQFLKQPTGVFTPPPNTTLTLTQNGSSYTLQERHGRTFLFNSLGYATNIVDQYNNTLYLTYSNNLLNTVTDSKSRSLTFSYGGTPSLLASISDNNGHSISLGCLTSYNSQGDLVSVTDQEGKASTYIYDANHQITATVDPLGQTVISNIYDNYGHITTQFSQGDTNKTWKVIWSDGQTIEQDPTGSQRVFTYDSIGRLVGVKDQLGNVTKTIYDGQNHVIATVSPLGETNQFIYDGNNNLIATVDPLGFTNQFIYDAQNNLISKVDARGNASTFGYNSQFSLTGSTNGAGDWVNYSYYNDGTLHTRTDSGGQTIYTYDSYGQLNGISYPNGNGESFVNNADGDVTSHTDARGFVSNFQYNGRHQLTNSIAPTNIVATVGYNAVGDLQTAVDPRGNVKSNSWSATRKLLKTTLPATSQGTPVVTSIYDNRDWLIRNFDPLQNPTQYTNDVAGRLVAATDPALRTTKLGYDADGRTLATTNAAGEVTTQQWDKRGLLVKSVDGAGHAVSRAYDAAGNLMSLTNRNNYVWHFQYDGANRLTNTASPLGRVTALAFNHQGLLASLKDPKNQTAAYNYDAKDRLTSRADSIGTTSYGYDANDNRTSVVENGKTNSWTYDAYNRVSSYRDTGGNLIQYRYDAVGNVTNLVYPGGKNVYYTYDSNNHVTGVKDWSGRTTTLAYDLAGHLTGITRPNGTYRTIGYDAAGEATNIVEQTVLGFPIALFRFNWNSAAEMQWEFAAPLPHTNSLPTRTMTYDADNELATLNGQSVSIDADGNLTSGPLINTSFVTYTYDARNRLLNAGGITNAYDAMNNRIAQTSGTNATIFVVNPNTKLPQMLMRIKNGVTNYYIYGAGLLYEITEKATGTNTLTYHSDYRGSTIALTDDNGNVVDRAEYSAYGTLTYRAGNHDTPFLFNGRYGVMTDPNGLLFMCARFYNPYICRFLNPDPAGFSGGLNFFAYANGNPVSYLDPFGLWTWTQTFGVLRTTGGGFEAAAGYGLAATGVALSATGVGALAGVPLAVLGAAVAAHGVDQIVAGAAQTTYSVQVDSYTSQTLQNYAGFSQNAANLTDAGISFVGSLGTSAATSTARAIQLTATSVSGDVADASLLTRIRYYDTGQLSLSQDAYDYYSLWPNAVDRGAAMVADQGWLGAWSQGSLTLGAREGTLFSTGLPTPLANGVGGAFFSGLGDAGQLYLGSSTGK